MILRPDEMDVDIDIRNKFNSEKVLDVTYANIQGIDQLVEKFRNSSVMDQDPAYRPKVGVPDQFNQLLLTLSSALLLYRTPCWHRDGISCCQQHFEKVQKYFGRTANWYVASRGSCPRADLSPGLFAPKLSAASKGVWRKRD